MQSIFLTNAKKWWPVRRDTDHVFLGATGITKVSQRTKGELEHQPLLRC